MSLAMALRGSTAPQDTARPSSRNEILARYRELREISKRHHHEILKHISPNAILHQARRLGLAQGKTLILDDPDEMNYAYDLAIHTAPPGRARAVDRYARSARFATGSDEALVLEAMRAACFSILVIDRRHETAGVIANDLFRRTEVWLVDIALEGSVPDGAMMATRLYTAGEFSMTAGVIVPFDIDMIEDSLLCCRAVLAKAISPRSSTTGASQKQPIASPLLAGSWIAPRTRTCPTISDRRQRGARRCLAMMAIFRCCAPRSMKMAILLRRGAMMQKAYHTL